MVALFNNIVLHPKRYTALFKYLSALKTGLFACSNKCLLMSGETQNVHATFQYTCYRESRFYFTLTYKRQYKSVARKFGNSWTEFCLHMDSFHRVFQLWSSKTRFFDNNPVCSFPSHGNAMVFPPGYPCCLQPYTEPNKYLPSKFNSDDCKGLVFQL